MTSPSRGREVAMSLVVCLNVQKGRKRFEETEKCRLLFAYLPFRAGKTLANVLWGERDEAEENKLSHYAVQLVVLSLLSLPLVIQIIPHSFPFVTQANAPPGREA